MKAGDLMFKKVLFVAAVLSILAFSGPAAAAVGGGKSACLSDQYGKRPLSFLKNQGQMNSRVKFYESSGGHETFFTEDGVVLTIPSAAQGPPQEAAALPDEGLQQPPVTVYSVELSPLGMQRSVHLAAEDMQTGKAHYFIGDDPEKWRTDIPTYRSVVYRDAYPGIDLKFYGNNQHLEYDIMVQPGGDLSQVKLRYSGVQRLEITESGDLSIQAAEGLTLIQKQPVAYQVIDGKRVELAGKLVIDRRAADAVEASPSPSRGEGSPENMRSNPSATNGSDHVFGFEVASYDKRYPLVVDPILIYSSYLGGAGGDYGYAIAVDASGSAYLTGFTLSQDFPTEAPFHGPYKNTNAKVFITKLNPAGDALVYSTYLGGSGNDYGYGIAVDATGSAYVAGYTNSTNFPRREAYQTARAGDYDAFVTKLGPSGNVLVYSTYLGGTAKDGASGIAVDGSGSAYIAGTTASLNFPLAKAFQLVFGGGASDAFVAKLDQTGKALIYSTYLGGQEVDGAYAIAVDSSSNAYVTGKTRSKNFLLENPYQSQILGLEDAFVLKLNQSGDAPVALVYATYLGGTGLDEGRGITVDASGSAYVTGATRSADFPVMNPISGEENNSGFYDVFVTRFTPSGNNTEFSTYLGGGGLDYGMGIAVDADANVYLSGHTNSSNFPLMSAFQTVHTGVWDGFVAKLNSANSTLIYSSYLGGSKDDYASAIAIDSANYAYVTGWTHSDDFPITPAARQPQKAGGWEAFVTKINNTNFIPPVAKFGATPRRGLAPLTVKFSNSSTGDITSRLWDFGDGQTSTVKRPVHVYTNPGFYNVSLTVSGPGGTSTKVHGNNYITADPPAIIKVTSPNGGEIWPTDSTQTITWSYGGNVGSTVRIELLMDGSAVSTISAGSLIGKEGAGSYTWKIPSSRVAKETYRITITTDKDITDMSDGDFSIIKLSE